MSNMLFEKTAFLRDNFEITSWQKYAFGKTISHILKYHTQKMTAEYKLLDKQKRAQTGAFWRVCHRPSVCPGRMANNTSTTGVGEGGCLLHP